MKTTIEFETKPRHSADLTSPWKPPGHHPYDDMILLPEYQSRKINFPLGKTWFRVLPALKDSRGWMLGVNALDCGIHGRFAHPKTLKSGAQCTFDRAYTWLRANHPELLYSKENKGGYRLLSKPLSLCWILVQENDNLQARIMITSGYNGERGGVAGLGHTMLTKVESVDENVDAPEKPIDPETGVQFCVEKIQPRGVQYPSYRLSMGRQPAPISDYISKLSDEDLSAIRPLEQVIRSLSEEDEWQLLGKVIGMELRDKIRSSQES